MSCDANDELPMTWMSPPAPARRSRTAPMASPAGSRFELVQSRSPSVKVCDATYLVISFMRSANGSPARPGQAAAVVCQVRRPNSSASVFSITSSIA